MNAVEVIIIAFIIYELLLLIKNSRAWTLLKGILVILVFTLAAAIFRLDSILWLLEKISAVAVIALVVVFQPELRKILEQLGSQGFMSGILTMNDKGNAAVMSDETIEAIVKATFIMAGKKTGALMVIEQSESLSDIEKSGIQINGILSSGLLINIFEKNTPLHDGAVVIRANEVAAATCYLPLSANKTISKDLGTRHRAALGISEDTDSFTIVVSEENGHVSAAENGQLTRIYDADELRAKLAGLKPAEEDTAKPKWWRGWTRNGED